MAESFHRQSLYLHKTIQQVSCDDEGVAARESSLSPDHAVSRTFGREFRLMCAICLQDLKQPKQLRSCYHIFCKDCLQPLMEQATDGKVICPLQHCSMTCPEEDISRSLSSDTYLHPFQGQVSVYVESGDMSCNHNGGHEPALQAVYFCLECGQNFCESCHVDHSGNDEFKHHHVLKLFKTPSTMTVGINRSSESLAASLDEGDISASYKCPICRNTDRCEHENWLKDLLDESFRLNLYCQIPEHANGKELIAYCTHPDCNKLVCRNCCMIEHKAHDTQDIWDAVKELLPDLKSVKKTLIFQEEMFEDAAKACDTAESSFRKHVLEVEQEMIGRKASMHTQVEEAFSTAFSLIEQTGMKQAELNRQSGEMHQEQQFLKTAILLAEGALTDADEKMESLQGEERRRYLVEVARIWKGLRLILDDLGGETRKKKSDDPEVVLPQVIVEKRLVLPAPSCMNPDLHILQKVGVEGNILHQAFCLQAEPELFFFYGILPLTETEALVSCKPRDCTTSVVQYSNINPERYSINLAEGGESCITAVPGNGIVATLCSAPGGCGGDGKDRNQVLYWDQALDVPMTKLVAQGAGENLKVLTTTALPPRGVAVTKDNHLVVVMARDPPPGSAGELTECYIQVLTLQGRTVKRTQLKSIFPRYVTVNINDDICVTDEKDRSVIVFDSQLKFKRRIINPYNKTKFDDKFAPRGICHDSFGRLIVADPDNDAVVRIEYDDGKAEPVCQELLKNNQNGVKDLDSPRLVAIGHGPRLWVVCRDNINVFEYMDKD